MYWGYDTVAGFAIWVAFAVLFTGGAIFMPIGVVNWMGCLYCYNDFGANGTQLSSMTVNTPTNTANSTTQVSVHYCVACMGRWAHGEFARAWG